MGRFSNRGITKNLIKKSKVVAIIQDSSAVRTIRFCNTENCILEFMDIITANHTHGMQQSYFAVHIETSPSCKDYIITRQISLVGTSTNTTLYMQYNTLTLSPSCDHPPQPGECTQCGPE